MRAGLAFVLAFSVLATPGRLAAATALDKIPSWCPTVFCGELRATLRRCAERHDLRGIAACIHIIDVTNTPLPSCTNPHGNAHCYDPEAEKTQCWAWFHLGLTYAALGQDDTALITFRNIARDGALCGFD